MSPDNAKLERELLENALDFIERSLGEIKTARGELERDNKYAAVFLSSGVELLFKARLVREHWSLVFDDPGVASMSKFHQGDFQSVGAKQAVQRLKSVVGIELDATAAQRVFDLRNRVIHFAPSSTTSAKVVMAAGLSFVATFLEEHLKPHLLPEALPSVEAAQDSINAAYRDLKDFADKRMLNLSDALGTKPLVVTCPECLQPAMVPGDVDSAEAKAPRCLFCYHSTGPEEMAAEYASHVLLAGHDQSIKDDGDYPVSPCLECNGSSLVSGVAAARRPKIRFACFGCGAAYDLNELAPCDRCGNLMVSDENSAQICGSCFSNIFGE